MTVSSPTFWHLLTRLGEAQILLPLMLLVAQWSALAREALEPHRRTERLPVQEPNTMSCLMDKVML